MGRELYQLVATDRNNNEYVIELNNENTNNKGQLSFLDRGISRFENEQHLAAYLYEANKLPTTDVRFSIRYFYNGPRYLPLIFFDKKLLSITKNIDDNEAYSNDVVELYSRLEVELRNPEFYNFLVLMNNKNYGQTKNGNYLNEYLMKNIIKLVEEFIKYDVPTSEKVEIQYEIIKSLSEYKQLRTLHYFYKLYLSQYQKEKIEINEPKKETTFESLLERDNKRNREIPLELQKAYDQGGMDAVWALADYDEVEGMKFK